MRRRGARRRRRPRRARPRRARRISRGAPPGQLADGVHALRRRGGAPRDRALRPPGRPPLTEDDMEPQTWAYTEVGRTVTGVQYAAGVDALRERGREIERWWEDDGWDLLLTPTLTGQTPPLGLFKPTKEDPFSSLGMEASTFTVPFNVSGQPAISLPLHWAADGMPIGVQLGAAHGREDVLIRVASQLEAAMPWAGRIPPVHA
ncbi:amidase family protein [Actinomadura madurae]|uniref:amidase family protein n=1 Tax=Actinomadura madurae TaxID=1993 RepID=UPI003557E121